MPASSSSHTFTRRDFVKTGSVVIAGGFASGVTSVTQALETSSVNALANIPIVDTHQHLWDLKELKLPWLSGAPETLKRSFVMSDYQAATANLKIAKSSGFNTFDIAGMRAVQVASPFPPLPQSYRHKSLGVNLILR